MGSVGFQRRRTISASSWNGGGLDLQGHSDAQENWIRKLEKRGSHQAPASPKSRRGTRSLGIDQPKSESDLNTQALTPKHGLSPLTTPRRGSNQHQPCQSLRASTKYRRDTDPRHAAAPASTPRRGLFPLTSPRRGSQHVNKAAQHSRLGANI
ncbi:hypothetical protein PIB30_057937 [Stylosanthes scabra]|uniref:Uncharacterized protein n=1 Tax=Stylosanthes scabra TaxID=79078 RepID=A0ABU6UIK4_9FABA|nr:hypothetical protein [Stylosanthes scabra]